MALFVDRDALATFERQVIQASYTWQRTVQTWLPDVCKAIVGVLASSPIEYVTGLPGSYYNGPPKPGRLVVFTKELLADVVIDHKIEQTSATAPTPVITAEVISRNRLQSLIVTDDNFQLVTQDESSIHWPHIATIELGYQGVAEPIQIPMFNGGREPTRDNLRTLLDLLPSLLTDLAR